MKSSEARSAITWNPKLAAGTLLAVSFLLPQYTCDRYRGPDGKTVQQIPEGADSNQYAPFRERHYAWEDVRWSDVSSWVAPAAFLWPLPVLVWGHRANSQRVRRLCLWLEPLLVGGSLYIISALSSFGERAVGAYVGLGANGLYGFLWLRDLRTHWAERPNK